MDTDSHSHDAYAERIAADSVRIRRLLPGTIERVWAWITDEDKRRLWLAGGPLVLETGGEVGLHFLHAELSDEPGTVPERHRGMRGGHLNRGRVTACDPPHLLAYTWGENHGAGSEVRFELVRQGDAVLLTVIHTRLSAQALPSVAGGWHTHLDILADRLHARAPGNFWSAYERIAAEYATRFAARSTTR